MPAVHAAKLEGLRERAARNYGYIDERFLLSRRYIVFPRRRRGEAATVRLSASSVFSPVGDVGNEEGSIWQPLCFARY